MDVSNVPGMYDIIASQCSSYSCLMPALLELYDMYINVTRKVDQTGYTSDNGEYINCTITNPTSEDVGSLLTLSMALVAVIIFAFFTKRVSFKRKLCNGIPGLALPMAILESHDGLIEYSIAFLSTSEEIYNAVFNKNMFGNDVYLPPIVKFFVKLMMVFALSISYYPIFAGLKNKHLVGYFLALCIAILLFVFDVIYTYYPAQCITDVKKIPYLFSVIFYCLFDVSLILIFLIRIVKHFSTNACSNREIIATTQEKYEKLYFNYVRQLLKQNPHSIDKTEVTTFKQKLLDLFNCGNFRKKIRRKVYKQIVGFSIPPRLIIGIFVGLYFAYRIFINFIYSMTPFAWRLVERINSAYRSTNNTVDSAFSIFNNLTLYSSTDTLNAFRFIVFYYANICIGCLIFSVIVGFFVSVVQGFLIVRSYRLKFDKLTRKGFSTIIQLKKAPEPHALILGFVQYSGFQAAYILWAIIVTTVFIFLLSVFLVGAFLVPLIYIPTSWARNIIILYGPVLIATIIFNIIQSLIVKYIFVKEKGNVMEINNRNAFTIFSHVLFFLNAMMGIFSSIKKAIVWIFFGVICFGRIDFNSMPEFLKGCDGGYMSFIGFLYTEQYHHNPILRCFVTLLTENRTENSQSSDCELLKYSKNVEKQPIVHSRMSTIYRNKWLLAFTLVNNQCLLNDRKWYSKANKTL